MRAAFAVLAVAVAVCAVAAPPCHAVTVRTWEAASAEAFARGSLDRTEIDHDGRLRLAPVFRTLWGPEDGIVWAVAPDGRGGAFVGLSDPGRVVHVAGDGEATVWYEAPDQGLVTAVAPDGKGGVWVGVSPAGLVVRVRAASRADEPVGTEAEFVWALVRHGDGAIWVATGSPGRILRIDTAGTPEVIFESAGDPVRCLALAPGGAVIAGTGLRGRVLRFDEDLRPFVLLDADEDEIVSVTAAAGGHLYALAAKIQTGAPNGPAKGAGPSSPGNVTTVRVRASDPDDDAPGSGASSTSKPPAAARPSRANRPGAVLYRIGADGAVWKAWESASDVPYAVGVDDDGRALVATGDEGRLLRVGGDGAATRVRRFPSDSVTALVRDDAGRWWIGGSDDARLARSGPGVEREGTFRTEVVDAGSAAAWGRIRWDADVPSGAGLAVRVRSGNTEEPDATWSPWRDVGDPATREAPLGVPAARWAQAELALRASREDASPVVRAVEIVFQPRNRPPRIAKLDVGPPGEAWTRPPQPSNAGRGPLVADDPVARQAAESLQPMRRGSAPVRRGYESGARTVSWKAEDPDDDPLVFSLDIRREGDEHWFPLAVAVDDEFLSWDSRDLPDGRYRVRLTAGDETLNAPGTSLRDVRVSEPFRIDNSPPEIDGVETSAGTGRFEVRFEARDPGGRIAAAEFAVDDGPWRMLDPEDGVADSDRERYRLAVPYAAAGAGEPGLKLRVTDLSGNVTGASRVLRREPQP